MTAPDFRILFESASGSCLVVEPGPGFPIVAASDAYLRATTTTRDAVVGRSLLEVYPDTPGDDVAGGVADLRASLERVVAGHKADTMAVRKVDTRRPPEAGGGLEQCWWSPANSPVLDAEGRLLYIIHRVEDVTDLVRSANGELAGATMTLQDISPMKELLRMREEWASLVAHDLKQPINAIVLTSDLMLRADLDDKTRDRVGRVRTSAKRLSRMVDDLKDASLIEAHHLRLDPARVELGALLRDITEHAPNADAADVRLVLPDQAMHAHLDAARIDQVLTNLLSNAHKYGEPGTPITVELRALPDGAEIAVTNHGEGIAADELSVLFTRHGRTRSARQRGVEGSGLGLYIAAGLVEAQGGRIRVESAPGETTTFRVVLPLEGTAPCADTAPDRQIIHA